VRVCTGINEVGVVDLLVFRGRKELEEINEVWKQKPHVMQYFEGSSSSKPRLSSMPADHPFFLGRHTRSAQFR
jgi:hypothetical protein